MWSKMAFSVQRMTKGRYHRIQYIQVSPTFIKIYHQDLSWFMLVYLEQTVLFFFTTFAPKGYFQSKIENMSITIEFNIFEFLSSSCFSLKRQFWFFWNKFALKRVFFSVENRKIKHHHRIKHIWISLDAKFHVKQIILIFLAKYAQKVKN